MTSFFHFRIAGNRFSRKDISDKFHLTKEYSRQDQTSFYYSNIPSCSFNPRFLLRIQPPQEPLAQDSGEEAASEYNQNKEGNEQKYGRF